MKSYMSGLLDGLALLLLAGLLALGAANIVVEESASASISPTTLPNIVAIAVAIIGAALILRTAWNVRTQKSEAETGQRGSSILFTIPVPKRRIGIHSAVAVLVLTGAYLFVLQGAGFILSSLLYVGLQLYAFRVHPLKAFLYAAATVAVIYAVFTYGFNVSLPTSPIFGF